MKRILLGISFLVIFAMVSTAAPPLQYHLAKDVVPSGFCVFSFKQTTCPTGFTRMNINGLLRSHPNPGSTSNSLRHTHNVIYNSHTHSFGGLDTSWSNNQWHCEADSDGYEAGGHRHYLPAQQTPLGYTPWNSATSPTNPVASLNDQLPTHVTITVCCRN